MAIFNRDQGILNTMNQFKPQPSQGIDWAALLNTYQAGKKQALDDQRRQDLANALTGGDQNQILAARAAYDPAGAAKYLDTQQQREQTHQWDMEKLAAMNNNAINLEKIKNTLSAQSKAPKLTEFDKTLQREQAKNAAAASKGEQAVEEMTPSVMEAMKRAEAAADNGSGLGLLGAFWEAAGLNRADDSGNNYADVQSANSQMNALLRQKLQATGLTGSELNSAVEANAYRYTISPFDNEERIKRKIANFRQDYLGQTPVLQSQAQGSQNIGGFIVERE